MIKLELVLEFKNICKVVRSEPVKLVINGLPVL